MNRIEIKCPCCNKRLYITAEDACMVDAIETAHDNIKKKELKEQEDRERRYIEKYGEEAWNKAMEECNRILGGLGK